MILFFAVTSCTPGAVKAQSETNPCTAFTRVKFQNNSGGLMGIVTMYDDDKFTGILDYSLSRQDEFTVVGCSGDAILVVNLYTTGWVETKYAVVTGNPQPTPVPPTPMAQPDPCDTAGTVDIIGTNDPYGLFYGYTDSSLEEIELQTKNEFLYVVIGCTEKAVQVAFPGEAPFWVAEESIIAGSNWILPEDINSCDYVGESVILAGYDDSGLISVYQYDSLVDSTQQFENIYKYDVIGCSSENPKALQVTKPGFPEVWISTDDVKGATNWSHPQS